VVNFDTRRFQTSAHANCRRGLIALSHTCLLFAYCRVKFASTCVVILRTIPVLSPKVYHRPRSQVACDVYCTCCVRLQIFRCCVVVSQRGTMCSVHFYSVRSEGDYISVLSYFLHLLTLSIRCVHRKRHPGIHLVVCPRQVSRCRISLPI